MPRPKKKTPMDKIELALIYIDDGALHTGAKLLIEAGQEIEAIALARDAAMEKALGARVKKP